MEDKNKKIQAEVKLLNGFSIDVQQRINNYVEELLRVPERAEIKDLEESLEYMFEGLKHRISQL